MVVTADHGDEFGEHGGYTHTHKLYDELIHVPLLVRAPGTPPRRVDEVVELVQVVPTILGEASASAPEGLAGDRLELRRAEASSGSDAASLSEAELIPNYIGCLREKAWKFIGEERTGREELYELGADPGERRNVIAAHPRVADRLREKWFERRRGGARAARAQKLSAADEALVEARLRDLGYL
jgi:arylsulfatase